MSRKRVLAGGAMVAVTAMLLAGCTSSGGDTDKTGPSDKAQAKSAPAQGGVLAEQTIDTPVTKRDTKVPLGGTMTVTVRSVVASEGRTLVTWALLWDDPDAPDGTVVSVDAFFYPGAPPVLTDGQALKYYYPLCEVDWRSALLSCQLYDALYSPNLDSGRKVSNRQTFEAWAIFPEVGKDSTTVDLALPGIAAFQGLPVTRS